MLAKFTLIVPDCVISYGFFGYDHQKNSRAVLELMVHVAIIHSSLIYNICNGLLVCYFLCTVFFHRPVKFDSLYAKPDILIDILKFLFCSYL